MSLTHNAWNSNSADIEIKLVCIRLHNLRFDRELTAQLGDEDYIVSQRNNSLTDFFRASFDNRSYAVAEHVLKKKTIYLLRLR